MAASTETEYSRRLHKHWSCIYSWAYQPQSWASWHFLHVPRIWCTIKFYHRQKLVPFPHPHNQIFSGVAINRLSIKYDIPREEDSAEWEIIIPSLWSAQNQPFEKPRWDTRRVDFSMMERKKKEKAFSRSNGGLGGFTDGLSHHHHSNVLGMWRMPSWPQRLRGASCSLLHRCGGSIGWGYIMKGFFVKSCLLNFFMIVNTNLLNKLGNEKNSF